MLNLLESMPLPIFPFIIGTIVLNFVLFVGMSAKDFLSKLIKFALIILSLIGMYMLLVMPSNSGVRLQNIRMLTQEECIQQQANR